MNAFDRLAATPPTISTKAELQARSDNRETLDAERRFTPKDADHAALLAEAAQSNEARIAKLRASLSHASGALTHDHANARLRGYAKARFERER